MAKNNPLSVISFLTLAASLCIALAVFAWVGTYSRMWADDYCYSAVAQDHEVLDSAYYWYQNGGNRFSTIIAVEASDRFGPYIVAWLPSLILLAWVLVGWFTLHQIAKRVSSARTELWSLVAALTLVFFSVLMLPSLQESLYWRMGMLHYTLPLLLFTLSAGLLLLLWPQDKAGRLHWAFGALLAPVALMAAGFSETYAAFQTCALLFGLAISLWRGKRAAWVLLLPALIGSAGAMALMALSPSNQWRQDLMPPPSSLFDLVSYTLRFAMDFYAATLGSLPVPAAVYLCVCCAFGAMAYHQLRLNITKRQLALGAVGAWTLGFILVAASITPSAYAGLQYPAERAQAVALYGLLLGLGCSMLLGGSLLRAVINPQAGLWRIIPALMLLAAAAYTATTLDYPLTEVQGLQRRAVRWDARHAMILKARADGAQNVMIEDAVIVSGLEDLRRDPQHWVNSCVAQYYDLNTIVETP